MKVGERWLREWVNPELDTESIADALTRAGLEVANVLDAGGDFSGVVVGEVLTVETAAEGPTRCRVSDGSDQFQILCNAPNLRPGLKAPLARVSAVLPGGRQVTRLERHQVHSEGMLCSSAELGLGGDGQGLMELATDVPPGQDLALHLDLNDRVFDLDLTPNRGDCLSIRGIARELAAITGAPLLEPPPAQVPATQDCSLEIALRAEGGCPTYCGRIITGVNMSRVSPLWLRERLRQAGIRSIDPVVDVTNYVMLELGQPLHAFDLATLNAGIVVRWAKAADERLELLDGREIALQDDCLVIADDKHPLALAGIMGGRGSGVSAQTRDIFLEGAHFTPDAIAGRARRFGLVTESSHRFERGVDPALCVPAIERATALLLDITGGAPGPITLVGGAGGASPKTEGRSLTLRTHHLTRLAGTAIPAAEVESHLARLGLKPETTEDGWKVSVPGHRFDLAIEEDLVEEVLRLHGYDQLPTRVSGADGRSIAPETQVPLPALHRRLTAQGYQEVITYSFVAAETQQRLDPGAWGTISPLPEQQRPEQQRKAMVPRRALALNNPLSNELAVMRTSTWPGLLQTARYNRNRQLERIRLFETGQVFVPGPTEAEPPSQREVLGGLVAGNAAPEGWGTPPREVDFFDLKADVEALLALGGMAEAFGFQACEHPALHPGQTAELLRDKQRTGLLGALHPTLAEEFELEGPVLLFEVALDALSRDLLPDFRPISRFPASRRDIALVVDEEVPAGELIGLTEKLGGERLSNCILFDLYRGKGIDKNEKSVAIGLTWQSQSSTLEDAEIEAAVEQILTGLKRKFGARLRD